RDQGDAVLLVGLAVDPGHRHGVLGIGEDFVDSVHDLLLEIRSGSTLWIPASNGVFPEWLPWESSNAGRRPGRAERHCTAPGRRPDVGGMTDTTTSSRTPQVLVSAASNYGSTAEIAARIGEVRAEDGCSVVITPPEE